MEGNDKEKFGKKMKNLISFLCLYNGPDLTEIGFRVVMILLGSRFTEEERNGWLLKCAETYFVPPISVRNMFPQKVFFSFLFF